MPRTQKQLNPIVTAGNKITMAVRSDEAELRMEKTTVFFSSGFDKDQ